MTWTTEIGDLPEGIPWYPIKDYCSGDVFSQPVGIHHPKWIQNGFERFYEAKNGWYWYFSNMKYLLMKLVIFQY